MAFKLLATILIILALYPTTPLSQWLPRLPPSHPHPLPLPLPLPTNPKPLCASQLSLVNRACSILPYARVPAPDPPSPPAPAPEEAEAAGGHRHHHHHHSRGDGGYVETAVEEECCRWLKQVDTVCVCELLVHLPPFMTRPLHEYKVVVDETCDVTFACASKIGKF